MKNWQQQIKQKPKTWKNFFIINQPKKAFINKLNKQIDRILMKKILPFNHILIKYRRTYP